MTTHNTRKEYYERAKKIFIEGDMSFPALSSMSRQLVGVHIETADLKKTSQYDPEGTWLVLREKYKAKNNPQANIGEQVAHVIQLTYNQIVAESVKGLTLVGDYDREEVKKRLEGVEGLEILEIGGKLTPGLLTAFMTLLDKSGIKFNGLQANRMTGREQALAAIRDEKERLINGSNS
jgi:hypothetical protein